MYQCLVDTAAKLTQSCQLCLLVWISAAILTLLCVPVKAIALHLLSGIWLSTLPERIIILAESKTSYHLIFRGLLN